MGRCLAETGPEVSLLATAAKIGGVFLLAFVAYGAYWQYQYQRAEADANDFCAGSAVGSDIAATIARATAIPGLLHGFQENETRYVAVFRGPIFNAFTCELTVANAKVTASRVVEPSD